jgi:transcriptional regulator with XRE-family HTH domain
VLYPNIEAERARKGMSYESMASSLNVSRKTIYNWLNSGNIPQSKLEEMADLFGCSTDYLLGLQGA